ncbi:MAG: flagellar biosynthesis protein FlhB [Eubacteriales bacterium]
MPESNSGERTEKATPKKRKDAREKGQVLKSVELVTAGSLLVMFLAIKALFGTMTNNLMSFSTAYFDGAQMTTGTFTANTVMSVMQNAIYSFLMIVMPILAIALGVGVMLNVIQVGFFFSTKSMGFKMERLSIAEGIKRIFSGRTLFELIKTFIKVGIVLLVAYVTVTSNVTAFTMLLASGLQASLVEGGNIIINAGMFASGAFAGVAALDYFFQRRKHEKDLMMTKYEIKMEYKQQEGDPAIKSAIRQKQRQMAMMRMMQSVPQADVVITNPTHFAVALSYKESEASAPKVLAKGKDLIAQKIKEVAREHKVEIVENRELAQSIFKYCEIGDLIPVSLYQAVAEILAAVYKMKNKDQNYRRR